MAPRGWDLLLEPLYPSVEQKGHKGGSTVSREPIEDFELPAPDVDWFLQNLVHLANNQVLDMPITLHVGGVVVTGTLISGRAYFEQLSELLAGGLPLWLGEAKEDIRKAFSLPADIYPRGSVEEREARGEDTRLTNPGQFIHLKDARFVIGEALVPKTQPVLWRGRLASVDGWVLGSMSEESR